MLNDRQETDSVSRKSRPLKAGITRVQSYKIFKHKAHKALHLSKYIILRQISIIP